MQERPSTMTGSTPARRDGSETSSPHNLQLTDYPTLKQSLSATMFDAPAVASMDRDGYFNINNNGGHLSPRSNRESPSLFVDIPTQSTKAITALTALTALQYLPTPLLVLSSLKTVILANEAMGRLLGLDTDPELDSGDGDGGGQENYAAADLYGKSLSQIGIDLLQDDRPVWVSWEVSFREIIGLSLQ